MAAGIDSLAAVELQSSLAAAWKLDLPSTLLFDYPSAQSMAAFIHERLAGAHDRTVTTPRPSQNRVLERGQAAPPGAGVAIAGLACRLPLAAGGLSDLALALACGTEATSLVPLARWDVEAHYSPDPGAAGRSYARFAAFLGDVAGFDAALFGLGRAEAAGMDPQHRLLLEETAAAVGTVTMPSSTGPVGVYVGCMYQEYPYVLAAAEAGLSSSAVLGNSMSFMVGRISFTFGFTGILGCVEEQRWWCRA